MEILELLDFGKYFVIGTAIVGLVVFIIGVFKGIKKQIVGGLLILLCAAAIGFCGYLIYQNMQDRVYNMLDEIYLEGGY